MQKGLWSRCSSSSLPLCIWLKNHPSAWWRSEEAQGQFMNFQKWRPSCNWVQDQAQQMTWVQYLSYLTLGSFRPFTSLSGRTDMIGVLIPVPCPFLVGSLYPQQSNKVKNRLSTGPQPGWNPHRDPRFNNKSESPFQHPWKSSDTTVVDIHSTKKEWEVPSRSATQ